MKSHKNTFENFPEWVIEKWQDIADILAESIGVPAALVMRTEDEFMQVFISSQSENNPYHVGDKEKWNGLYCETVIKSQHKLSITNALKDKNWDKNPDIKLGMIAYLGIPLNFPNRQPFGTLCILDNKENSFKSLDEKLLLQFKNVIELDLALIQTYDIKTNELSKTIKDQQSLLSDKNIELQKEKEKAEESEKRYSLLIDNVMYPVLVTSFEGNILYINQKTADFLDVKIDEYQELKSLGLWTDKAKRNEYIVELRTNGFILNKEVEFCNKHDQIITVIMSSNIIDYNGQKAIFSIYNDITERKKAEENLMESQRKLATLMGNLPGLAYRCKNNQDWTMSFMSEGGFELTGFYPHELEGNQLNSFGKLIHLDDLEIVWQKVQEAIKNHTSWQIEYRIVTKDGKEKWVWEQGCGVYSNTGELEVLEGFITDITEQRNSEIRYQTGIDNAPIAIGIGVNMKYVYVNKSYVELTGYTTDELLGMDITYIVAPECLNEFAERAKNRLQGLPVENTYELTIIKKDNSRATLLISASIINYNNEKASFVFAQDLTARKLAERALSSLATNFAGLSGKAFFEAISKHIATEMGIDYIYVGELTDTKDAVRVLGGFSLGEAMGEMLYDLSDTPCSDVIKNDTCLYPTGIQQQYPKDYLLQQMGIDSYLGSRIYNKEQEPIGILVALHSKPINNPDILRNLFSIFLDRIAAELQRMHAFDALHKNEAIQRKMISNIGDVIVIIDKNGINQFKSLNIEKWFGWKPEELIGKSTWDNIHPDDLLIGQEFFGSIMNEPNASGSVELRYRKKDDSYCWIEITIVNLLHDPDICGLLGNYHDITERKQAEDKLRDSQVLYHDLVETSQDMIWQCDAQGRYIYLNLAYEKIFGYQLDEMLGRSFTDFQSPQQAKHNLEVFGQLLQVNGIVNGYESVGIKKDGTELLLVSNAKVVFDAEGNMSGTRGTTYDITQRKKTEANLSKLYTAINSSKASIVITDTEGNIEFANPYFSQLTGYSEDEYLGKNPQVLKSGIHTNDFYKELWDTIKSGNSWEGEFCNRKKNGELYWEKSIITAIKNEKDEIVNFVAVKSDITNEKKHEFLDEITLEIYEKCEHLTIEDILNHSIELGIQLSDSEIGFFHFVNDDQETISLQAWSAKTMDICNIPTLDKHYPISKAGVWVDCFYQKKPVFHNDYTSLSHKKGLPEGHATLIRDLSVPVIVENKVVAIFGVGNKVSDYTKIDAELLSIFAENVWNIVRRKTSEIELIDSKEQIHRFASHLQNVREEEKIAIAREIHDDLGQILVALQINMGLLKNKVVKTIPITESSEILPKVDNIVDMIKRSIKTARNIMNGLRPELLELRGLVGAIVEYLREFEDRHQIGCEFDNDTSDIEMTPQQSLALFRILQESMNNIVKHANATLISIKLQSSDNKVVFSIIDNGVGFDKNNSGRNDSYGMIGMKERVVLLKGGLEITSKIGQGTTVRVEIPL